MQDLSVADMLLSPDVFAEQLRIGMRSVREAIFASGAVQATDVEKFWQSLIRHSASNRYKQGTLFCVEECLWTSRPNDKAAHSIRCPFHFHKLFKTRKAPNLKLAPKIAGKAAIAPHMMKQPKIVNACEHIQLRDVMPNLEPQLPGLGFSYIPHPTGVPETQLSTDAYAHDHGANACDRSQPCHEMLTSVPDTKLYNMDQTTPVEPSERFGIPETQLSVVHEFAPRPPPEALSMVPELLHAALHNSVQLPCEAPTRPTDPRLAAKEIQCPPGLCTEYTHDQVQGVSWWCSLTT